MGLFGEFGEFMGEWTSGAGNVIENGANIAKAVSPWARTAMKSPLGKALGPAGNILSGISAGFNLASAYENFDKGGYHCDKAWNNVGGTILGGTGAALAACPVAGAYLAAGEGVANVAGAAAGWGFGKKAGFSADNIVGGLARGMYGDRSIGSDVANSLGGGFWGQAAGTATNVLASPINLLTTVGGGIANEIGAIGSGIWNGEGAIGGGIHAIGSGISSAASAISDW